ncbi:MAG: toxic anion resistance protein [Bacillus sp. (in: firmicutes)]
MSDDLNSLLRKEYEKEFSQSLEAANEKTVQIGGEEAREKSVRLLDVLKEEEKKRAYELAEKLDPKKHREMIFFGAKAQKSLLSFSHAMLEHVKKKDVGEVSDIIGELMGKLNEINPDELKMENKSFFARLFGRMSSSVQEILSKYQKTGAQIDRISVKLERSKNILLSDIHLLEQLYENNKEYFYALNIYIAAAEWKLEDLHKNIIPEMKKEAETQKNEMKRQEVDDMLEFADRLDSRIYDLKISRQITLQTAPQIRLIQNTNKKVIDKIQSSILTTIPLWRNQVAIALSLLRQRHAVETQNKINKANQEIIKNNAKLANHPMIEKENNSGFAEIDLLKNTQLDLISTLKETWKIQEDARESRIKAEQDFALIDHKLKTTLEQIKNK